MSDGTSQSQLALLLGNGSVAPVPKYVNMRRLHTLGRDEKSYGCGCVGGLSTVRERGRDDEEKMQRPTGRIIGDSW